MTNPEKTEKLVERIEKEKKEKLTAIETRII